MKRLCFALMSLLLFAGCDNERVYWGSLGSSRHIVIPDVAIGNQKQDMVFDTGASHTAVTQDVGLDGVDSISNFVYSERGKVDGVILEKSRLRIGEFETPKKYHIDQHLDYEYGTPPILGADIINDYHWLFDFRAQRYAVSLKPIEVDSILQENKTVLRLDYKLNKGLYEVALDGTDNRKIRALFDLGRVNFIYNETTNITTPIHFDILCNGVAFRDLVQLGDYTLSNGDNLATVSGEALVSGAKMRDFAMYHNPSSRFDEVREMGFEVIINVSFARQFDYMLLNKDNKTILLF